jgi:hypothetical protein
MTVSAKQPIHFPFRRWFVLMPSKLLITIDTMLGFGVPGFFPKTMKESQLFFYLFCGLGINSK